MSAKDEYGGDLPITSGTSTRYPARGCAHCPAAFFSNEGHHAHMLERHPDKPVAEEWESSEGKPYSQGGKPISNLVTGDDGEIMGIQTHAKMKRQGHATELLNAANEHAEATPGVPKPAFSKTRTSAGEKFQNKAAKRLGGEVPPRRGVLLSPRQMQGMLRME